MAIKRILHLLNKTAMKWWDDNPWRLSAALSYYTLFSLASSVHPRRRGSDCRG